MRAGLPERVERFDVERLDARDLTALPVMSKTDLMAHFDDILTNRRLTLARAEDHLDSLGDGDAYLDDRYHVVASGGSSGRRGVFVWDWDGWTNGYSPTPALTLRDQARNGEEPVPALTASVMAAKATHMTAAFRMTFRTPLTHAIPITLPLDEIVAALNRVQPVVLGGFASALALLASEAHAGRLRIKPRRVISARRRCTSRT